MLSVSNEAHRELYNIISNDIKFQYAQLAPPTCIGLGHGHEQGCQGIGVGSRAAWALAQGGVRRWRWHSVGFAVGVG